jgi:hypothetical protein
MLRDSHRVTSHVEKRIDQLLKLCSFRAIIDASTGHQSDRSIAAVAIYLSSPAGFLAIFFV